MQDRPDKAALLGGVARFLEEQVRPAVADPGLAYRIRVAAHLLGVVLREQAVEDQADRAHLDALSALIGVEAEGASSHRQAIRDGERELARRIREGEVSIDEALPVLQQILAGKLASANPRFDLAMDIEG